MEYWDGGDLSLVIKKTKKKNNAYIEEDVIWKIFAQLWLALKYCHYRSSNPILHRDIKPANVFIGNHDNVKLGDFGLSKELESSSRYAETNVGTPYYMSPEQINEEKYNNKSDIWSLGCIIYETCALKPPFQAENYLTLAMKIKDGKITRIPKQYSDDLQNIIRSMLNIDPDKRPSVQELISNNPKISIKIREMKVKDMVEDYHKREEALTRKEKEFKGKIMALLDLNLFL